MANWQYPTGAYKAYVPGGRFGRGLGRGIRQFGEGAGQWAAQMMAIKQWEAEKEEKRKQRLREQAAAQVEALAAQQEQERQLMAQEAFMRRKEEHDKAMARLKASLDIQKTMGDKKQQIQTEVDAIFKSLQGLATPRARRMASKMYQAWESGNLDPIHQVSISAPLYPELAYGTTKTTITEDEEGKKKVITQGAIEDQHILQEAARKLKNIGKQLGYKLTMEPVQLGETADLEARVREALSAPDEKSYRALIEKLISEEGYALETIKAIEAKILAGK